MAEKKKEPIKKGSMGASLSAFKENKKINNGSSANKPEQWIKLSPAFRELTGLDGIPKGNTTLFRGFSNTGKSTALIETAVGVQKRGELPIIIDTENSWNWLHASEMGFEFEEVWDNVDRIDEETGEVKTTYEVVDHTGQFIYINNRYLIEAYGRKRDKNRDEAVIEDVGEFCHTMIDDQNKGELPYDITFLWDSIGTLDCEMCVTAKNRNNMWNAGAYETTFKSLLSHRIPASRNVGSKYTNTFVAVQKIWLNSQGGGQPTVSHKGGEAFWYFSRIIIHFGGIISKGTAALTATAAGKDFIFATKSKLAVVKNHNIGASYKGDIICTAHGFVHPDELDAYKKQYKTYLLKKLDISEPNVELDFNEDDSEYHENAIDALTAAITKGDKKKGKATITPPVEASVPVKKDGEVF